MRDRHDAASRRLPQANRLGCGGLGRAVRRRGGDAARQGGLAQGVAFAAQRGNDERTAGIYAAQRAHCGASSDRATSSARSEEHTSELQSLMRISYAVFCLKKKKKRNLKTKRKRRHRRKHVYNPKPTTKKYNNKKHKEKYTHNQHKPSMTNK